MSARRRATLSAGLAVAALGGALALPLFPSPASAQATPARVPALQPSETATPEPVATGSPLPTASPAPSESPTASPTPTLPPAGVLPTTVSLAVTGNPADPQFLQRQISATLDRAIRPTLQEGAGIRYGTIMPPPQPLGAGFETTFDVPVTLLAGTATAPVQGVVHVNVRSVDVPPVQPALLSLDDDPEYIRADGVLFRGTVTAGQPKRVYYYHENVAVQRRFMVLLSVAGGGTSRVQIIDASAGPNPDVMTVGHAVSRSFILMEPQNEGVVMDVSTRSPFVVRDVAVNGGDGVSGAVDLRVLDGAPVTMTVMAIPQTADPLTYLSAPPLPGDGHNRHGTFALSSVGQRVAAYTVGGQDASIEYGTRGQSPPNVDSNDPGQDAGDYGVLQRFLFDITNPSNTPATVYLYMQPNGGVVRNSYVVNGVLTEVGCARLSRRYRVGSYDIGPRTSSALNVLTMSDGGSNYPVEVGVTTTPPLPTTPPISAPDGCFPKPSASAPPATPAPTAAPFTP